MYLIYL